MKQWISMEEARDIVIDEIAVIAEMEEVSVFDAVGRVAGEDYIARYQQPPFDRSPLDGFAFRHEDVAGACKEHPVTLTITHKIFAGDDYQVVIGKGEAARIMTGAGIPNGADCVIRQEDVDYDDHCVTIYQSMKAHDNICDAGEDMKQGTCIIQKGEVITPAHGAVLAGQGFFSVQCYRKSLVGVLSTGSELIEHEQMKPGKIYNSNGPMVGMRLQELGMKTVCGCCSDLPEEIKQRIDNLLESQDVVITTGGVSVGDKDYLPAVMEEMGAEILFHGITMKPGSPMLVAKRGQKMIFCLSGNPFAAMATLELIVLPGLCRASGRMRYMPMVKMLPVENAFLKASKKGRRLIRGVAENGKVHIPENHSSGSIASMIGCNCLLDIPAGAEPITANQILPCIYLLHDNCALTRADSLLNTSMPVVCICGSKNVGKTTVMEQLIQELTQRGYQIGAIKHDGHTFTPDVEGRDSARFFEAGAKTVGVYAKDKAMIYEQIPESKQPSMTIENMLHKLEGFTQNDLDVLLIEGLKDEAYPKIEVMRKEISRECVANPAGLLAVCSDFVCERKNAVSYFSFQEIAQMADVLEMHIKACQKNDN